MSFPSILLATMHSEMPIALLLVPWEWLAASDTPRKTTLNLQYALYVGWGVTCVSRPVCELSSVLSGREQLYNNTETNKCMCRINTWLLLFMPKAKTHSRRHDQWGRVVDDPHKLYRSTPSPCDVKESGHLYSKHSAYFWSEMVVRHGSGTFAGLPALLQLM